MPERIITHALSDNGLTRCSRVTGDLLVANDPAYVTCLHCQAGRPDFAAVLEFLCPSCGALPGESCVGGIAERENVPHPARLGEYMHAVILGLGDRRARQQEWLVEEDDRD